ncbi:hypothetical protein DVH24_026034 [Malus domestica]|uniref:Uncharacterized protein n=1 Tax=Malus domestica TaxID=3750 RepID=A0A498KGT1_MALDO|nr:hypothetical protein DVH24_026034 [Malus domestica]
MYSCVVYLLEQVPVEAEAAAAVAGLPPHQRFSLSSSSEELSSIYGSRHLGQKVLEIEEKFYEGLLLYNYVFFYTFSFEFSQNITHEELKSRIGGKQLRGTYHLLSGSSSSFFTYELFGSKESSTSGISGPYLRLRPRICICFLCSVVPSMLLFCHIEEGFCKLGFPWQWLSPSTSTPVSLSAFPLPLVQSLFLSNLY